MATIQQNPLRVVLGNAGLNEIQDALDLVCAAIEASPILVVVDANAHIVNGPPGLRKALEALNKSSDAVWKEINEFDKPVSSEVYGWWEQAQIDAYKALAAIAATEEGKSS